MNIEYTKILNLFMKMVEANKGIKNHEVRNYTEAEGLAIKFAMHALTIFYLSSKTKVDELVYNVSFLDVSSLNVIARASFETYLTFHFLFLSSLNENERDLRFLLWELDGLQERQRYSNISKRSTAIIAKESERIAILKQNILSHAGFDLLNNKTKKKLRDDDNWVDCWRLGKSWKDIAKNAGFSDAFANDYYAYLAGYAHSSHSSMKNMLAFSKSETPRSIATFSFMQSVIAHFIYGYKDLFANSREVYDEERVIDGDVDNNPKFVNSGDRFSELAQGAILADIWYEVGIKKLKTDD